MFCRLLSPVGFSAGTRVEDGHVVLAESSVGGESRALEYYKKILFQFSVRYSKILDIFRNWVRRTKS